MMRHPAPGEPVPVAVACGGTGGHFYPALAIACELRNQGATVTFLVAGQQRTDHRRLAEQQGFAAHELDAPRRPARKTAWPGFLLRFGCAVLKALAVIRKTRPHCLLGMGSFAAGPACAAAVLARCPLALHEGNAIIGKANRMFARHARLLAVSLPLAQGQMPPCQVVETGLPLRQDLIDSVSAEADPQWYAAWGLAPELPTILVFGGSQGAQHLNETVSAGLCLAAAHGPLQVIHLTGQRDNQAIEQAYAAAGLRCHVSRGESCMERCYAMAGLVICRAGAASISELALFGKAAVLIPLPSAADDHQTANARMAAAREAALHLPQAETTPAAIRDLVADWRAGAPRFASMAEAIRALARPTAAAGIARQILETVGSHAATATAASEVHPA